MSAAQLTALLQHSEWMHRLARIKSDLDFQRLSHQAVDKGSSQAPFTADCE